MKLHQLRYLVAVADHDLNITAASLNLHTVQPGVSKQLMLLEEELGFKLFVRRGRSLIRVTAEGERVLARSREIVREVQEIRNLATELRADDGGTLSIATTHTQARYVLPAVLQKFRARYPSVQVHLHQGDTEQIAALIPKHNVDLALVTGGEEDFPDLIRLPCFRWRHVVVVPKGHPLTLVRNVSLQDLSGYPLITQSFNLNGPSVLLDTFTQAGIVPDIALTTWDADVLKTYLRSGLGIGIMAGLAADPVADQDLSVLDADIFPEHTTWLGFRRGTLLRSYIYDLIGILAPHLSRRHVQAVESLATQEEVDAALASRTVPFRSHAEPGPGIHKPSVSSATAPERR